MAYVRGQERFVYEQVNDLVRTGMLQTLSWNGTGLPAGQLPWGASQTLKFVEQAPDPKKSQLLANTIALSEGRLPDDEDGELGNNGGGLYMATHTFFVDIYGEDLSIARSIAGDVRSLLTGRATGTRYVKLQDWRDNARPALAGHLLHFEDVEVEALGIGSQSKLHWYVVKASCIHEFNA